MPANDLLTCIDDITAQVLQVCLEDEPQGKDRRFQTLKRALPGIGYAGGHCAGMSPLAWLNDRFKAGEAHSSPACSRALEIAWHLTDTTADSPEWTSLLTRAMGAADVLLRGKAAGIITKLTASASIPSVLIFEMLEALRHTLADSSPALERRQTAPAHPSLLAHALQELRQDQKPVLTRAAILMALSRDPHAKTKPEIVAALRQGLADRFWIVGVIAAEGLHRMGLAAAAEAQLQHGMHSPDRNLQANCLRALARLAAAASQTPAAVIACLYASDMRTRAGAIEALAQAGGAATQETRQALHSVLTSRCDALHPLALRALRQTEAASGACPDIGGFLQAALRDDNGFFGLLWSQPAKTPMEEPPVQRDAFLLALEPLPPDNAAAAQSETGKQALQALALLVRGTLAFRALGLNGSLFFQDGYVCVVFFQDFTVTMDCVYQVTQALHSPSAPPARLGLHHLEGFRLQREGTVWEAPASQLAPTQKLASCGDAGHVLLSQRAGQDAAASPQWRDFVHTWGACSSGQGDIFLCNLHDPRRGIGHAGQPLSLRQRPIAQKLRAPRRGVWKPAALAGLCLLLLALFAPGPQQRWQALQQRWSAFLRPVVQARPRAANPQPHPLSLSYALGAQGTANSARHAATDVSSRSTGRGRETSQEGLSEPLPENLGLTLDSEVYDFSADADADAQGQEVPAYDVRVTVSIPNGARSFALTCNGTPCRDENGAVRRRVASTQTSSQMTWHFNAASSVLKLEVTCGGRPGVSRIYQYVYAANVNTSGSKLNSQEGERESGERKETAETAQESHPAPSSDSDAPAN